MRRGWRTGPIAIAHCWDRAGEVLGDHPGSCEARKRTWRSPFLSSRSFDAVVAHRQIVLPHRALWIALGQPLRDLQAAAVALEGGVELGLGGVHVADAVVRHGQIAPQPNVLRIALENRLTPLGSA